MERRMIAATSSAPFQKCVAPGMSSSSTAAPARLSASASRTLCAAGTRSSAVPCRSRIGGAPARAWFTGLACRARSGTDEAGAPRSRASRESGPGSGTPPASARSDGMPARSVTGNQATAARTAGPVSAASSARWPPAESPHRHTRSASSP
jgi:hypothetical protein